MFFRGRAFVEVTAERILDEGSSSSSTSASSSPSSSTLRPPYSENVSGRSRAPVTSKIASNSEKRFHNIRYSRESREEGWTFWLAVLISAPGYDLMPNIALPVDNYHRYPGFRNVRYAFIAHDRSKFSSRIPLCQWADVLKRSFASRQPVSNCQLWCLIYWCWTCPSL